MRLYMSLTIDSMKHFEKLFDAARLWGYSDAELMHVSFGTVMGPDGKPYKTRSGDTVGLEGLLDQAEGRALEIAREQNSDLDGEQLNIIAKVVGIGGLKYADLSHNRSSDYVFSYDKMLALKGNTGDISSIRLCSSLWNYSKSHWRNR